MMLEMPVPSSLTRTEVAGLFEGKRTRPRILLTPLPVGEDLPCASASVTAAAPETNKRAINAIADLINGATRKKRLFADIFASFTYLTSGRENPCFRIFLILTQKRESENTFPF
jgi:hypothetical protein